MSSESAAAEFPNLHVSPHPLVRHKIRLLSDAATGSKRFRELIDELTPLLLYESTTTLPMTEAVYQTPLEPATGERLAVRIGIVPILRAGLGMVDAALTALPEASVWHLGMYRDEATHRPISYYNRLPERCPDDVVIVLDPMLATGGSATAATSVLKDWGARQIIFVGMIAAPEGVRLMLNEHPDVHIHVARLDRALDANKFIRPGLGDAGDRLYATSDSDLGSK